MNAPIHIPYHWLTQLLWLVENNTMDGDVEANAIDQLDKLGISITQVTMFVYRDNTIKEGRVIQFPTPKEV